MTTKIQSIMSAPVIQSGDQTQNNSIRRKWFALALGGFLFISIFALSAHPVEAQCSQWNVAHAWQFKQGSGQGAIEVKLDLHQNGTVITGTASHVLYVRKSEGVGPFGGYGGYDAVRGTVDGTVERDSFAVKIYWDNNTIGVYDGTIRSSGRIEGKGWEQSTPGTKVNWHSVTTMVCADAAPVKPPDATKSASEAADDWINQERSKRKTAKPATTPVSGSGTAGGFIQMHTPAPTPSAEADESSSNDTDDQHGKHKKNKKKHHHHDDEENQGND